MASGDGKHRRRKKTPSNLARPLYTRSYRTNLWILRIIQATFAVVFVAHIARTFPAIDKDGGIAALVSSGHAALAVFIAWGIARELSPDDHVAAFLALPIMWALWIAFGAPSISLAGPSTLFLRSVNRTIGPAFHLHDTVICLLLAGGLFVWFGYWSPVVVGVASFVLDGFLMPSPHVAHGVAGLALAAGVGAYCYVTPGCNPPSFTPQSVPPVLWGLGSAFLLVAALSGSPQTTSDNHGTPINGLRVQSGMVIGLLSAVLCTQEAGVQGAAILWAAVASTVVGRLLALVWTPPSGFEKFPPRKRAD